MNIRWAILPGFILGSLCVFLMGNLIVRPDVVLAYAEEVKVTEKAGAEVSEVVDQEAQADKSEKKKQESEESSSCEISSGYSSEVRQWCDIIQNYSRAEGLDPNLVAALITQESGGNPRAYSSSGAVGLMQVMPRDGLAAGFMCINGPCFASRPSMEELYDPEFNISYGVRMLSGLVNKHGSVREALVAYGPRDVGYYYADKVLAIYNNY